MATVPTRAEWTEAAKTALPMLAKNEAAMRLVLDRFRNKYLRAALEAGNEMAEERAWDGFFYWLVAGSTNRKPFSATDEQADALILRYRELSERVKQAAKDAPKR